MSAPTDTAYGTQHEASGLSTAPLYQAQQAFPAFYNGTWYGAQQWNQNTTQQWPQGFMQDTHPAWPTPMLAPQQVATPPPPPPPPPPQVPTPEDLAKLIVSTVNTVMDEREEKARKKRRRDSYAGSRS